MKPWNQFKKECSAHNDSRWIGISETTYKEIQLDAYKAGMTRAAEIADENQMDRQTKNAISKRILTTRDSLTELPL